jgi:hypothetical protein
MLNYRSRELIKFCCVQGEEASALLEFFAGGNKLNIDATDELICRTEYCVASCRPQENSIVMKTINEEEVTDVYLPEHFTSFP